MDLELIATVFGTIFLAELSDKMRIATLLHAADAHHPKLSVFVGAVAALLLASALGNLAGAFSSQQVNPKLLSWLAGAGFLLIGLWAIVRAWDRNP